ncbi:hypothetical protein EV421DRAFT_2001017 [Armillaria borealis]|uniref:Heterokaryon incompatibility domain-containing protein n=1 Tax=Armillaria borealis TaxID=47425 RepID=A0AA39IZ96_9AGAR|nr:hypothetical protein EV421DRAFT_2001017 [Armillaria borealis]
MTGGTVSEKIPASSSNLRTEPPSTSCSESSSVDSDDTSDGSDTMLYEFDPPNWPPKDVTFAKVTISAFTETGQAESSIEVPLQRSYTSQTPVIPSSLADTPCATLGIQGVLDELNATLRTTYTLDTPSLPSILDDCVEKNYNFGTAYGRLRQIWYANDWSNIRDKLRRREEKDRKRRQEALVDKVLIVEPYLPPRRIPSANIACMGGYTCHVPIPKDASLDLLRIEMLNLGVQYMWLDVLCLRQKGGTKEDIRVEEWKLDVPIIGRVYRNTWVVIYLSGLGLPLKEGNLDSKRCWFRHAWILQEVGEDRIIAGDTSDGPMHAEPIDEDGNYETGLLTRFHKQLGCRQGWLDLFRQLAAMQKRVSTNPVDKVAGLAFPLMPETIPAYHESESLEDAWMALVNSMYARMRLASGLPLGISWSRTRTQAVETDMGAGHDGHPASGPVFCLALKMGMCADWMWNRQKGGDRCGELVVEGADGMQYTFAIRVTHQIPIPEGTYTLLGSNPGLDDNDDIWGQYWAVGLRLPRQRFKKVSVVMMEDKEEIERLEGLGIAAKFRNILV